MGDYHRSYRISISCLYAVILAGILEMSCYGHPKVKFAGIRNDLGEKLEGTQTTIETDYGDIIDCVDIYKQPSLRHIPKEEIQLDLKEKENENAEFWQDWHRFGECPPGTIPILRDKLPINYKALRKAPPAFLSKKYNHSLLWWDPIEDHEYASVSTGDGIYYGGEAVVTVWNPSVEISELTLSQMWVVGETASWHSLDTIEAGWMVYPELYHDYRTRIFIYWSSGKYSSGCYNTHCTGFVQTYAKCVIGAFICPVSKQGGNIYDLNITMYKDVEGAGHWWLKINGNNIGYWPKTLFNTLSDYASAVSWGGEIVNHKENGRHTTTQMGSGQFASAGLNASFFEKIKIRYVNGELSPPTYVTDHISKPGCYNLTSKSGLSDDLKHGFFYGGPGYSSVQCPK